MTQAQLDTQYIVELTFLELIQLKSSVNKDMAQLIHSGYTVTSSGQVMHSDLLSVTAKLERAKVVSSIASQEETVTLTKAEYDRMSEKLRLLHHLQETGVDNWEGYSYPPDEEDGYDD